MQFLGVSRTSHLSPRSVFPGPSEATVAKFVAPEVTASHGYLLTTDFTSSTHGLIQAYLDRWQIELLHRDLRNGLGVGQVQAFSHEANQKVHGAQVAAYSMLGLAGLDAFAIGRTAEFPELPARRKNKPSMPVSQHYLITMLRNDLARKRVYPAPTPRQRKWALNHRETYQAA